ncbi:MAG: type I-F CRISPR-associated protein Csy2 [Gammaproteobacteria bacterium]|nr:type I-F CRISPR-associated protein Csy2 [Gammaproteobacteria bacterium]
MNFEPVEAVLTLPRLWVQNANAVSSPLTWGFPPPSAFAGFVHALQRRLQQEGHALQLEGVGIICHDFEPQTFRPPGHYHQVFRLTRNPLNEKGETAAIVEDGRAHLSVSLVIGVTGDYPAGDHKRTEFAKMAMTLASGMRLAGGSVLPHPSQQAGRVFEPELLEWPADPEGQAHAFHRLRRQLLPGFALVGRDALLAAHRQQLSAQRQQPVTALDALLDLCRLNVEPHHQENGDTLWQVRRAQRGWLVPLPVGYAAISLLYQPGEAQGVRDRSVPFRFVESLLSLGEWVSPHRITSLQQLFWHHQAQPEQGLYRLLNHYLPNNRIESLTQGVA